MAIQMNIRAIRTVMVKDLKEVAQNKGAWIPAVVVPFLFMVLVPAGITLLPQLVPGFQESLSSPQGMGQIIKMVGPAITDIVQGLSPVQSFIVLAAGYLFAPFLMVMPLMLSTIVGAESFVGEKERKTLEALIYTPASDGELFLGKVLASVVPAVGLTWISAILYGIVVNVASYPVMGYLWFPPTTWWPLMFWLAPALSTLGMGFSVLISIRTNTFMEAYQTSGSLVVLVLALVIGQVTGVLFLSVGVILLIGLLLWLVDAVLIWFGIHTFARSSLLARI